MTKQELIANIRSKNQQYSNLPDGVLYDFAIKQKPELVNQITDSSSPLSHLGVDNQTDTTQISTPPKNQGLIESIKNSFTKRTEDLGTGYQRQIEGKQGLVSSALQTVGQGAGFTYDIAGDVLNKGIQFLPGIVKKSVSDTINKLADSMVHNDTIYAGLKAVNSGIDKYKEWENQHPEAADNVKALVNIALMVPGGEGTKVGLSTTGKEVGMAGRALEASGKASLDAEKQSFVRDLVSPVKTKAVKEAQVARTTETGSGIFKKSVIAPSPQELNAENSVLKVEGVNPKKTYQQNYNIISDANTKAAQQLESDVANNDFIVSRKEVNSKLNEAIGRLSESPTIVGDAQKTAEKLVKGAMKIVSENSGTGSGILKARKAYDNWVKSQKPKAFDSATADAFSLANKEVRNTLNNILDTKITNVDTKALRLHQSALYDALDTIKVKAAQEADTAFGRLLQKTGQVLGTKNKIVQGLAAAAGIGGLGAAATFAPAAAVIGGAGLLIYKGSKLVLNPQVRIQFGRVLQEIEKALPKATPSQKININNLKQEINATLKE